MLMQKYRAALSRLTKSKCAKVLLLILILIQSSIYFAFFVRQKHVPIELHYENCDKYPNDLARDAKETGSSLTFADIESRLKHLALNQGGRYAQNRAHRVALVVPYRNRLQNLKSFLLYMHTYLSRQNLVDYAIYLVEPMASMKFNRALLMNIGFLEASKDEDRRPFDCFIFHDVDLVPENETNLYACDPSYPKQFSISISIYNYVINAYMKNECMGGVTGFTKEQFRKLNGYSNLFYDWGGEDDDMRTRCLRIFGKVSRLEPDTGKYFAFCHREEEKNSDRMNLLKNAEQRMKTDGLNSIKYSLIKTYKQKLFTVFYVKY